MLYTRILVASGYHVFGTDDGLEALRVARLERPGIILMDVGIPGMNGWEVARALKEDDATRRIPIIIMSGDFAPPAGSGSLAQLCDVFLPKPISVRHLMATIMGLLPVQHS